jgi:ubiquinone/menaquinone biosynthesis C-methylase UbiE
MTFWRWKAPVYSFARRLPLGRKILTAEQDYLIKLLQQISPASGIHLDVGSGTGDNLSILPFTTQRLAVDAEFSMLAHNPASLRVVAQAQALPFREKSFSFVSAIGLLEYVEDFEKFFIEVRRVLQLEGYFLFTSSPPNWANHLRLAWGEKLHFYTEERLGNILKANDWKILGHSRSWLQEQWLATPVGACRAVSPI